MRVFIFLAILAPIMALEVNFHHQGVLTQLQERQARLYEKEIIAMLECLREFLRNGDSETRVPPMDPLGIKNIEVDLSDLGLPGVDGIFQLSDFLLNGITGWDLSKLKISITVIPMGAKMEVVVSWPNSNLVGWYNADIKVFDHTIVGSGKIDGNLNELKFELTGQAIMKPISIKSANFKVSLNSCMLTIEKLSLDGQDISPDIYNISTGLPAFFKENEKEMNEILNKHLIPIINEIIDKILNSDEDKMNYDIPGIGKCFPKKMA